MKFASCLDVNCPTPIQNAFYCVHANFFRDMHANAHVHTHPNPQAAVILPNKDEFLGIDKREWMSTSMVGEMNVTDPLLTKLLAESLSTCALCRCSLQHLLMNPAISTSVAVKSFSIPAAITIFQAIVYCSQTI